MTKQAEEGKCVCGHLESKHDRTEWYEDPDCGPYTKFHCSGELCECRTFRAVLSWPDSEGWWWFSNQYQSGLCYVIKGDYRWANGESGTMYVIIESDEADERREEYEQRHGPARFTKLLENNPFSP